MKFLSAKPLTHFLLIAVAVALPMAASAQWQWIDKSGRKVFSDQPPPPDVAEQSILKRPSARATVPAPAPAPATSAALAAASAAARAASAPKLSGKDAELEAKKKQAEQEEAKKKKADEDKLAADRAQNCERAKANLATLGSGRRIQTTNAQGEREIMGDEQRAAESKRIQDIINRDCNAAGNANNPK